MRLALATLVFYIPFFAHAQGPVQFNRDIRPILSDNCFLCHGPDSARRKADLRLDTEEGLFGKREDAPAVVKGQPDKSAVMQRLLSAEAHKVMPPPKTNKKLTAAQTELLRRWILEGAPFEQHWAFVKPTRPAVPEVKNKAWVRNPIDAFVLAKLEAKGLTPAPEADRRTLIRRLSLDLIGLPPTPEEVESFVNDRSADAYAKVMDRLMASEHYGEHRGRYWLDASRYADTHGLHFDNYREMWPYRDWVIRAFNKNQPFDQFTVEQLAGDLLPTPTRDQLIATGFHRCNITTNEGGTITEEVLVGYARDRVETTAAVWMGVTANCCTCHNHKFDPLSQKEFYQLAAYFRNTTQGAMDGNIPDTPPIMVVPRMEDRDEWDKLQARSKELKATLAMRKVEGQKALSEWLHKGAPLKLAEPLDPAHETVALPLTSMEKGISGRLNGKASQVATPKGAQWEPGPVSESRGVRFGSKEGVALGNVGAFDADRPFTFSAWVFVPAAEGNFTIASKMDKTTGWRIGLANRIVNVSLAGTNPKTDSLVRNSGNARLEGGKWAHVVVTYDGGRHPNGLLFYLNGKLAANPRVASKGKLTTSIATTVPMRLGDNFQGGGLADVRLFDRAVNAEEVAILSGWLGLSRDLAKDPGKINPKLHGPLGLVYFNRFDPVYRKAVAEAAEVEDEIQEIRRRSPVTHVMAERPGVMPTARILNRGQYDQPREEVKPGIYAALGALPKDAPANRLGLAQWLISPEHPLTARVTVNRFWQEIFGTGIVKTVEDFGAQGEMPTHPELLDWLAVEFRESGWDVKKFFKLILTSNTYRQAAVTTPEKREKDPQNRYLSRGPRYRMDGEMIRDYALAASGLLVKKIGGPSVKPYQPEGVWESVGILGASNTRDYRHDAGDGLYRRSMYWFWKRMAPPASLEVFNAPNRETCTVRRERTNTALQAMVTMNDPQYVEAARHLAQLALRKGLADDSARLDFVALRLLARPFRADEHKIVQASLNDFATYYRAHPKEAAKLIAVGDSRPDASLDAATLAAWTMVANEVMNLDEVLNK